MTTRNEKKKRAFFFFILTPSRFSPHFLCNIMVSLTCVLSFAFLFYSIFFSYFFNDILFLFFYFVSSHFVRSIHPSFSVTRSVLFFCCTFSLLSMLFFLLSTLLPTFFFPLSTFSLLPVCFFLSREFSSHFIRFHSFHLVLDGIYFSVLIFTFLSFFLYNIFDHLLCFSIFLFFTLFFRISYSLTFQFFSSFSSSLNHNLGSCYYCTRYYSLYPLSIPSTFPNTPPLPYSVFLHWRLSFTPLLFLLYPLLEPILTPTFINSDLISFSSSIASFLDTFFRSPYSSCCPRISHSFSCVIRFFTLNQCQFSLDFSHSFLFFVPNLIVFLFFSFSFPLPNRPPQFLYYYRHSHSLLSVFVTSLFVHICLLSQFMEPFLHRPPLATISYLITFIRRLRFRFFSFLVSAISLFRFSFSNFFLCPFSYLSTNINTTVFVFLSTQFPIFSFLSKQSHLFILPNLSFCFLFLFLPTPSFLITISFASLSFSSLQYQLASQ
ncbi:unnamed protein product [Acanthosepion pharaonis]|uniref:Uncharacterized protein n=1 Tax=Acanthosepion pharaonis TaxID=158019 RepID=A0A812BDS3_ACAPH|nr:unnamed protein product [Sepia pharaonis]